MIRIDTCIVALNGFKPSPNLGVRRKKSNGPCGNRGKNPLFTETPGTSRVHVSWFRKNWNLHRYLQMCRGEVAFATGRSQFKKTRDLWRIKKLWAVILGARFGATRGDQFHYQLGSDLEPPESSKSHNVDKIPSCLGMKMPYQPEHLTWMLHDFFPIPKINPEPPNNQELK